MFHGMQMHETPASIDKTQLEIRSNAVSCALRMLGKEEIAGEGRPPTAPTASPFPSALRSASRRRLSAPVGPFPLSRHRPALPHTAPAASRPRSAAVGPAAPALHRARGFHRWGHGREGRRLPRPCGHLAGRAPHPRTAARSAPRFPGAGIARPAPVPAPLAPSPCSQSSSQVALPESSACLSFPGSRPNAA